MSCVRRGAGLKVCAKSLDDKDVVKGRKYQPLGWGENSSGSANQSRRRANTIEELALGEILMILKKAKKN